MVKDAVKYVYFVAPVQIRMANTIKPQHTVSSDRFELEMKANYLVIKKDGFTTLVPVSNIASIMLEDELPEVK
jgi:hypothetical protein